MNTQLQELLRRNSTLIFSKTNCVQCKMTKRVLAKEKKMFYDINISQHPEWLAFLKEAGYRATPVVFTDTDSWSGFRPDKLSAL